MPSHLTRDVGAVLVAYALGCIQTGYYLVRARTGQDLRRLGSGGTGARNVGRVLGRTGFLLTLLGDVVKGVLALLAAQGLHASEAGCVAALVAVTVGHVWPAQLRFSGGRGIAVALGGLLAYDVRLLGLLGAVTLLGYAVTRRFQASGLIGFLALPLAAWWLQLSVVALVGISGLCMIILLAHRTHIARWMGPAAKEDGAPVT